PLACAVRAVAPVSNILRRLFPSPPHGDQSKYFKYYRAESIITIGKASCGNGSVSNFGVIGFGSAQASELHATLFFLTPEGVGFAAFVWTFSALSAASSSDGLSLLLAAF
ncbi:MAG: hypothetical protein FWD77_02505, partial [Betaproteobacteria bacterium]|nr:hypothetical protein [Betaproteobacteria bacterium]